MASTSAQACANTVIGGWVARFVTPAIITSNRGPQFTSAVWTVLCHRQLKETLRPRNCNADGPASALHLFALRPLTGAGRSLYRWRRPRAADRDEFKVRSSPRDDPLPADLPGGSCGDRRFICIRRSLVIVIPVV
jgi:hypothetical protein